ncbi:hypothetical protein HNR19_000188 [Nocardioides thalensis]|uniref:Uncharacterized protein n=1 Tax=Nocardioides thalensis TaxID=1914755 RepID=A0A853BUG2_9ACTN|nr:hypothetical protein [Nocardioides thalensis]NYI99489.1 hypothetical protein [Nocardioides thalensis]
MAQLTRGPLPPEVYWRRRLFVLTLAASLLFVIVSVLRGGSDASDDAPVAQQAGADVEPSQTVTVEPRDEQRRRERRERRAGPTYGPTFDPDVLAQPDGYCKAADVLITPEVDEAVAGRDVTIGLSLRSTGPAACLWRLSDERIVVRVTRGAEEVWTTRECGDAIPERVVTVRDVVATVVEMTWEEAKESDPGCPGGSEWLQPGDYSVAAATLGGEPGETDFELETPTPATVTPDADPTGPEGEDREPGEKGDRGQKQPQDGEQSPEGGGGQQPEHGDRQQDVPIR